MRLFAAAATLLLCAGVVLSAEYTGTLKSISDDGKKVTITIKDVDKTFNIKADAKVKVRGRKGSGDIEKLADLRDLISKSKKGRTVILVTEGEKDAEMVTEIKSTPPKKDAE